jgi:hypothetical protein
VANINVNTSKLKQYTSNEENISKNLKNLSSQLTACNNSLRNCMSSSGYGNIQRSINSVSQKLVTRADQISQMSKVLNQISSTYTTNENYIKGSKKAPISIAKVEIEKSTLTTDDVKDFLKQLGSISSFLNDKTENTAFNYLDSGFGYFASLLGVATADSGSKAVEEWLKLFKSSTKVEKSVYTFLKNGMSEADAKLFTQKYGTSMANLGIIGSAAGIAQMFVKASNSSITEIFSDSKTYVASFGTMAKSIYNRVNIANPKLKTLSKEFGSKVNAIGALVSAGGYAVGDAIELGDKGYYTVSDVGDILLTGGLGGLSSLASAYTLGIVDVNMDEAKQTFYTNIDAVSGAIAETDWNMPTKIAAACGATIPVTAVSLLEVAGNTVIETVDKIENFESKVVSLVFN